MNDNIVDLKEKFERIKKMGWVKEQRKGFASIGYTFESLLGKEEDDFPMPDYGNIEIKTMNDNAKTNLHLFTLTPDGDYLFPIKRILDRLGCPLKDATEYKMFYRSFNSKDYTSIGKFKKGKIFVNYKEEKIDLLVYDEKNKNININVSWSFSWLEQRLLLKLKYLAVVRAASRITNHEGYYYYHKISFFKIKDFKTFLKLIDDGIIAITFKIGVFREGKRKGQVYDHGTDFSISIDNLNILYDEINVKEMVK